jgi:uncharacterized protein YfiM (DUF2279 family)
MLLPLLLLTADTGRAAVGPLASPPTLAIYGESAINRESRDHHDRWFGEDKFKHLAFSYMITVGTFGAARLIADRDASITLGAIAGVAAGIGKEIYDAKTQGPSARDLIWDALGIAAAVLIAQETR